MRCGCVAVAYIFSIYLKPVLYPSFLRSSCDFWDRTAAVRIRTGLSRWGKSAQDGDDNKNQICIICLFQYSPKLLINLQIGLKFFSNYSITWWRLCIQYQCGSNSIPVNLNLILSLFHIQAIRNVLKYHKYILKRFGAVAVRLRLIFQFSTIHKGLSKSLGYFCCCSFLL